jgi:serine/threonine protein kinase
MQGAKEFLKEINVLGNYRHQNLLPLLGFCISKEGSSLFCALIYPQMRVSLEDALQQSTRSQPGSDTILSASHRLVIAMDAAAGLAYLHSSNDKPAILHRDMKSSNILLDADNRARISDVGLARPMEAGVTQTGGLGTFGYMDIVYLTTGEFSPPSDVFSLGVVFLELLTGQAACDSSKRPPILHARVGPRLPQDTTAVCDALARWPAPMAAQFAGIAKDCICPDSASRPTSQAVLERLSSIVAQAEPQQPQQPPVARECIICMDAPRNTRLRPCCHVVLCDMCAAAVLPSNSACPVCRARIQTYDVGDFNATFVPA